MDVKLQKHRKYIEKRMVAKVELNTSEEYNKKFSGAMDWRVETLIMASAFEKIQEENKVKGFFVINSVTKLIKLPHTSYNYTLVLI